MIPAGHPLKNIWDVWIALLTVAAAVEIPLRIAFDLPLQGPLLALEIVLTASFSIDLLLNFFTTVREHNREIKTRREIASRYLRTWFVPDLLACLPLVLLTPGGMGAVNHALRMLRLFELNRMLKLGLFADRLRKAQQHFIVNPSLARLIVFFFWITLFAHWTACAWVFLGPQRAAPTDLETYINALYWTVTTLSTVGYGDITPVYPLEKLFTMMLMVAGVASYGYLIGNVSGFLENMDSVRRSRMRKIDQVNSFLKYREIPAHLRDRVHSFYGHLWESDLDHDETRVLGELPGELRTDIALFMHRRLIQRVPFFRDANDEFIRDVVTLLKPVLLMPETVFIRAGETGDRMYFIDHGLVEVCSRDGQVVYETLEAGNFVGEMALLLDRPRTASVRTRGYCDLYVLDKEDFLQVLDRHPDFKEHIDRTTRERLRQLEERENG